jgi:hypothetical protein
MAKSLRLTFKRHSVQIAELDHKLHWVYWTADQIILTVRHVTNSLFVWSPKYEVDSAAYPSNTDLLQQMIGRNYLACIGVMQVSRSI